MRASIFYPTKAQMKYIADNFEFTSSPDMAKELGVTRWQVKNLLHKAGMVRKDSQHPRRLKVAAVKKNRDSVIKSSAKWLSVSITG